MKKQTANHRGLEKHGISKMAGWFLAAVGFIALSGLAACGVKGPPVPPKQVPPPAVSDLSYHIEKGWARLSWSMPKAALEKKAPEIAGFLIYRSRTSLKDPCKGCPLMFQRIGRVSPYTTTESARRDTAIGYADKLEKGYRYVYKVVAVMGNNVGSADSNLIEFNYGDQ